MRVLVTGATTPLCLALLDRLLAADDVDLVLAIGLARRPGDRFGAAIDFAGALVDALDGRLSPELRARGEAMIKAGAWTQSMLRPSTARLRGPGT